MSYSVTRTTRKLAAVLSVMLTLSGGVVGTARAEQTRDPNELVIKLFTSYYCTGDGGAWFMSYIPSLWPFPPGSTGQCSIYDLNGNWVVFPANVTGAECQEAADQCCETHGGCVFITE